MIEFLKWTFSMLVLVIAVVTATDNEPCEGWVDD